MNILSSIDASQITIKNFTYKDIAEGTNVFVNENFGSS